MNKVMSQICAALLFVASTAALSYAQPISLPDYSSNSVQYGSFSSYSLPILAYQYDLANPGTGVGPGTPYYVGSSPGQIQDFIVVMTGANGGPVNTNFAGMDDSFEASGPGTPTFSMAAGNEPANTFAGDLDGSWDSQIAALKSFLGTTDGVLNAPVFMFNNNQEGTSQNLFAWGQIWFEDAEGINADLIFDFTNTPPGGLFGGDPSTYVSTFGTTDLPAAGDYVLSGGAVDVNADGNPVPPFPGPVADTINHNLGENQVAYAIISPQINAFLASALSDEYETMHLRLLMDGLNNGAEQLFIVPGIVDEPTVATPEPGTMILMGVGVLGAAFIRRRKIVNAC